MKDKSEFVYYRVSRKESESFENVNIGYGRLEPRNYRTLMTATPKDQRVRVRG